MNKSNNKETRDKLLSIRVNGELLKICLGNFKSNPIYLDMLKLNGSTADFIEYLLLEYYKKNITQKQKRLQRSREFFRKHPTAALRSLVDNK